MCLVRLKKEFSGDAIVSCKVSLCMKSKGRKSKLSVENNSQEALLIDVW